MESVDEMKQEQYGLKARLHGIIELINNEEFFKLSDSERGLVNQQRVGMELYLSCLTKRIYGDSKSPDTSNLVWLSMLFGMFNTSSGFSYPSSADYLKDQLKESDFEPKEDKDE